MTNDTTLHARAFGVYVRSLRNRHSLQQNEVAERLSISPGYVCKLEAGKLQKMPSHDLLSRMASLFGVPHDDLLQRAGKLDLRKLQRLAETDAREERLLFKVQAGTLSEAQWALFEVDTDETWTLTFKKIK